MALQSSGTIYVSQINPYIGLSATANIWFSHQAMRNLAGVSSGLIKMSNFYGKPVSTGGSTGDTGGGGGQCVAVSSFLPDGKLAGEIQVGDTMMLADETTLDPSTGVVTMSVPSVQPGYRFRTSSGASLVCSDSAPIPTKNNGYKTPIDLLGQLVPVRHDAYDGYIFAWELVESVESVGDIEVQMITVGDKCFWAGEQPGAFILHHNLKQIA